MRLTVLTNNLMIVNLLAKSSSIHLVCTGGDYTNDEKAFSGNGAIRMLENYYVDASFLSCRSLSLEHGVTDRPLNEAWRSSLSEQGCILIDGQRTLETLVRERPDLVVED